MTAKRNRPGLVSALLLALVPRPAPGEEAKQARQPQPKPWERMNYGPFLTATVIAPWPKDNIADKGITIRLGGDPATAVCFDTDLLRMSAGWTGGFLNLVGTPFDGDCGPSPTVKGTPVFATAPRPGWARNGAFKDPRPRPYGPLPADWAKYKGLYLHGDQVVLSYTVGACPVLELPGAVSRDGASAITRAFRIGPSADPLILLVCEREGAAGSVGAPAGTARPDKTGPADAGAAFLRAAANSAATVTAAGAVGAPAGAAWEVTDDGRVLLHLPALAAPAAFTLVLWSGPEATRSAFDALVRAAPAVPDLEALCKGGPPRWGVPVVTHGTRAADGAPYVVDTLTPPFQNPWNAWMRFGGHDFFSDGRAALCTWSGDVWTVSGIDDALKELTWRRVATGLFQPLGLRIVDDRVYVLGRDQITRLHDLDGDGEADFYENFNNDSVVTSSFHEFATGLETDAEGNFYYLKGGAVGPTGGGFERVEAHHGCVMKLSKDGRVLEVVATGLRAPNGLSVGPRGEVTCGDNQGTWTPACRLNLVAKGGFYGTVDNAHRDPEPTDYDRPVCWLPMRTDNSSGGQVWVAGERWGPFTDRLLHLSYGKCALFLALLDRDVDPVQGAVVRFPLRFDSGIMRGRFNARDGQLYVSGLKGWQTSAARDGAFQRVRYTGMPVRMPTAMRVTRGGIDLTFTAPLDPASAGDPQNWGIELWNYRWTHNYGSPDVSIADPKKEGRDPVEIVSAALYADGKTVALAIPDLRPAMQFLLKGRIKAADGASVSCEVAGTIHAVPR